MHIRYNPIVPINYRFLFCIVLIFILSIWMEVYMFHESSLKIPLYSLFSFWFIWFTYDAIQNKLMHITKITMDTDKIIIVTLDEKYIFDLDEVLIEETWLGCIKILKISNKFHLSSAYINAKDFTKLEQKLQKNKININDLNLKFKILLFATTILSIMTISNILNIEFDGVLYSIIGIYLVYQIFKKSN